MATAEVQRLAIGSRSASRAVVGLETKQKCTHTACGEWRETMPERIFLASLFFRAGRCAGDFVWTNMDDVSSGPRRPGVPQPLPPRPAMQTGAISVKLLRWGVFRNASSAEHAVSGEVLKQPMLQTSG